MTHDAAEGTAAIALLICLFVAVLIDTWTGSLATQLAAFILASPLQVVGTILIHDLEYGRHHHQRNRHREEPLPRKPPLASLKIPLGEIPTISDVTTAQSEDIQSPEKGDGKNKASGDDDPSDYTSMASISTALGESGSYDEPPENSLECVFGFTFPLVQFFLTSLFISTALLISSLTEQVADMDLSVDTTLQHVARALFVFTYGLYLSSTMLAFYKRFIVPSLDTPELNDQWLKLGLSGFLGVLALLGLLAACVANYLTLSELRPFQYSRTGVDATPHMPYRGQAWVKDAQVASEYASCLESTDSIPVDLTVLYGGEWACPEKPDILCQTDITVQLECTFFFDQELEDDAVDEAVEITTEEYVHIRYHDSNGNDDAAYDYEEQPSFQYYWNNPSENILGSCDGTCMAESESWAWERYRRFARSSYGMYLCLGASFCFLGWPIYELVRQFNHDQNTAKGRVPI